MEIPQGTEIAIVDIRISVITHLALTPSLLPHSFSHIVSQISTGLLKTPRNNLHLTKAGLEEWHL